MRYILFVETCGILNDKVYNNFDFILRTRRIPGHLTDIYNNVFRPFKLTHSEFCFLIQDSKVLGIGPGDFVFHEGDIINQDMRYLKK